MRILVEESDDFFSRINSYIDTQSEKGKIPKSPKFMCEYLRDLCEMWFGEYGIISQEYSQHEGAAWANITVKYEVLLPTNGMRQSNSPERVSVSKSVARLVYWKYDKYHSISFSEGADI